MSALKIVFHIGLFILHSIHTSPVDITKLCYIVDAASVSTDPESSSPECVNTPKVFHIAGIYITMLHI